MNRLILSAFILILVSGCNIQQKRIEKCQKWGVCATSDSISYIETLKIDTIVTDNSEMWLDMLFECDSNGQVLARKISNVETENADLKMKLTDNRLIVYVKQPNDTIYTAGKNTVEYKEKTHFIKEPYIPFWNLFCTYGFYVLAGLIAARLLIKRLT